MTTETHTVSGNFTAQADPNTNPNAPAHNFRRGENVHVIQRMDRNRRPYYTAYVSGYYYIVPPTYFYPTTYSAGNYISIQELANRLCQVQLDYNSRKSSGNSSGAAEFDDTISLLRNILYALGYDAINCANVVNYQGNANLSFRSLDPSQMAQTICQIKIFLTKYNISGADAATLNSISSSIRSSISNLGYTLDETNCIVSAPPVIYNPYYTNRYYYNYGGRRRFYTQNF